MLTALTHLSRSPLEQNIIQPLVLSLLHLCRSVVNMPPGNSQPRGDFLYHSICNWVQDNYAQPLTRESVAQFFNITPNHLSKLFAQHGTMRFIEYVRWVRMAKARMILQKYHLSIHEVAQRCGFPDSDYFCRVFRRSVWSDAGESTAPVFRANVRRLILFPAASGYFVHLARQTTTGGSFYSPVYAPAARRLSHDSSLR